MVEILFDKTFKSKNILINKVKFDQHDFGCFLDIWLMDDHIDENYDILLVAFNSQGQSIYETKELRLENESQAVKFIIIVDELLKGENISMEISRINLSLKFGWG